MRYQLVLQFAADTLTDYDALVALENQLIGSLGHDAVDGHDMGSGEANVFIHTTDPQDTFRRLVPVLERGGHIFACDSRVPPHRCRSLSRLMAREFLATVQCCVARADLTRRCS
jgi:hypothetical protein